MPDGSIRTPRIEKLTSSIREMASRVNAEFIPDTRKSQTYGAASEIGYQMISGTNDSSRQRE